MNIQIEIQLVGKKLRFTLIDPQGEPSVVPLHPRAWRDSTYRFLAGNRPRLAIDDWFAVKYR